MTPSDKAAESSQRHVTHIKVRKLFGHLNYDISTDRQGSRQDDLLIIYGDNGSGKTTLLRLLYNTLSTKRGGGRKTYLAQTPFEKFEVQLSEGCRVTVTKKPGCLVGGYKFCVVTNLGKPEEFDVNATPSGELKIEDTMVDDLINSLGKLHVSLYFLPDDRRVQADFPDEVTDPQMRRRWNLYEPRPLLIRSNEQSEWITLSADDHEASESHHLKIGPVLNALVSSFRRQAIQGSNTGEENAGSIYLRVVEGLKGVAWPSDDAHASVGDDLVARIQTLNSKVAQFSRFGLHAGFPGERLISALNEASTHDKVAIREVLQPYLEGLEARLSALQELHDTISTYVETVNFFFSNKQLGLTLQGGINVTSHWGDRIEPDFLSSGEKQLLLLLSNTILARKKSSIFIIDEPELSLNVIWQRQLVDALLKCSHGGSVQYILASHSLELITQYHNRTERLLSIDKL